MFTGFHDQSLKEFGKLRGQSAKDMSRLLSAASQAQLSRKRQTFQRVTSSVASASFVQMPQLSDTQSKAALARRTFSYRPATYQKQTKSGITAVD